MKIKIKNKKKLMYIVIGIMLVATIVAWIFIIRKSTREEELEVERLRQLEEESGYEDAKTRPLIDFEDELLGDVEDMIKVGEQQEEIEAKYPWYYDLPIENDNYVILWDWEKEQFRIALKVDREIEQSARDKIIQDAITDIEELTDLDIKEDDYYIMFVE